METLIYSGITIVILIVWITLERNVMTPHDIYRKLESDLCYIAPENVAQMLIKVRRAIRTVSEIHDAAPKTEAAEEALEVLRKLRLKENDLRQVS